MTLTIQDYIAIFGGLLLPAAVALVWVIRLEAKVTQQGKDRLADLSLLSQQRLSDGQLSLERQRNVDDKLGIIQKTLDKTLDTIPNLQRSVDLVAARLDPDFHIRKEVG